jgi:cytochrome bd ubiquinol oxidase subunit II
MELELVWFILIAVLFVGFFFLEGFDYGVGILMPFLGKNDRERRSVINTIGPFWDANEVWLITAGGAMFAAFPNWYATLFSGFYLALFVMLIALIFRAVAFEFRSKADHPRWRQLWDWLLFGGSFVPALLWGVAMGNLIRGVRIDANMHYVGSFFDLLNWYALMTGLATLSVFTLHGAVFLSLRTTDELEQRAHRMAKLVWIPAVVLTAAVTIAAYSQTDMVERLGVNPGIVPLGGGAALLLVRYFLNRHRNGWAFVMTGLNIIFSVITVFVVLYPRVMISTLNPEWSLTIYSASSSEYTLRVMSVVAIIFVPVVLAYQAWSYYVFRQRITSESHLEY